MLYVLQSDASCALFTAIISDSLVRQVYFGMHTLDCRHQAHQVQYCIRLVDGCAEAEADAHALRKKGVQLERQAQQVRAASKRSNPSKLSTAPNTEEVSAPQQHASPQRVLPSKQDPAQQMHKPFSVMSQLPAEQPQKTQQGLEQRLPSEDAFSLNAQQPQIKASVTAEAVQHAAASPQAQAAAPQQEEQTPLATAQSAAGLAAHEEVRGVVAQHEGTALSSVLQGMVVWGNFKGWPAWPGLVTTEEEMDVAEVIGKRGQLLQGV